MKTTTLTSAVENFASLTRHFTDPDLDRPWAWKGYEEGGSLFQIQAYHAALHARILKTLAMLSLPPSETGRLLRIIYQGLAAVENVTMGDEDFGLERQNEIAANIDARAAEIAQTVR